MLFFVLYSDAGRPALRQASEVEVVCDYDGPILPQVREETRGCDEASLTVARPFSSSPSVA